MDLLEYLKKTLGLYDQQDYTKEMDRIREIEEEMSPVPSKPELPESKTYERWEYTPESDDELRARAESSLAEYRSKGVNSVEDEIRALADQYESERKTNARSYEDYIGALAGTYDDAVEAANNDALRRGLARSSIAASTTAALRGEQAAARAEAERAYLSRDAEIENELTGLEAKRQKALSDFDIAYTAKLTEQIGKLREEREQLKAEALKYNNSLAEKENAEQLKRAQVSSELYSDALDQKKKEQKLLGTLTDAQIDSKNERIYQILREKLLTMSAGDARNEVRTNRIFRDYLSDTYFYKLYDEFGRRD